MTDGRFLQWNKLQFTYTIGGIVYHCITRRKGIDLSAPDEEILVTKLIGVAVLDIPQSFVECGQSILECDVSGVLKEQEKALQALHTLATTYSKRAETEPTLTSVYQAIAKSKNLATEWLVACLHSIMRVGDNKAISTLYTLASMRFNDIMPTDMYKHMIRPWRDVSKLGRKTLPDGVATHLYTKTVACMLMTLKDNYDVLEGAIFAVVNERYEEIQPITASVKRFHNNVLSVVAVTNKDYAKTLQLFHIGKEDIEGAISKLLRRAKIIESGVPKEETKEETKVGLDTETKEFSRGMSIIIGALDPTDETQASLYAVKRNLFITDIHKIFNNFLVNERIPESEVERRIESISLLGSKDKQALIVIEVSHGIRTDSRTYPFMQGTEVPGRSQLGKITGVTCKALIKLLLSDEADKYVSFLDCQGDKPVDKTPVKQETIEVTPPPPKSTHKTRKEKRGIVLGEKTVKILEGKMHEKIYGLVHNKLPIITLEKDTVYTIYEAEGAIN